MAFEGGAMMTIAVDDKALKRALFLFPKELKYNLADAFDHIGRSVIKDFRKVTMRTVLGQQRRPIGFFKNTRRSLLISQNIEGMGVKVEIDSKTAPRHEFGLTVRSKKHNNIAAPLSRRREMFTAGGKLRKRYKNPDKIKRLFKLTTKQGEDFLVQRKGRGQNSELIFRYVLKKSINTPAQLKFYKTFEDKQKRRIEILNKAIKKTIFETF